MTIMVWIVLLGVAMVGWGLAVLSRHDVRRRPGRLAATGAVGGLLLLLGVDVLAVAWWLVAVPLALVRPAGAASPAVDADPGAGRRLAGGVLAAVLFAALYLVAQQADWQGLPAEPFRAGLADLGGRLLTGDALLAVGLLLATVVALGAPPRGAGADDPEETP